MNGFYKLKERLQQEGWYVGWGLTCCQTCAWMDIPYEHEEGPFIGEEVDLHKVLFNHEQDCDVEPEPPEGLSEEEEEKWWEEYEEESVEILLPTEQNYSMFCFAGSKEGVENLKAILPIIEECGCTWSWNQKGDQRIEIGWELN